MIVAEKLRKLQACSADELIGRIRQLAAHEKKYTVAVIAHLAEINRRRLHLDRGYRGLFDYCTRGLGFSEGSSWLRVQVANKCVAVPQLLEELAEGTMTLSVAGTLAPVLTGANQEEILKKGRGLTKRQAEELAARYKPREKVSSGFRAVGKQGALQLATGGGDSSGSAHKSGGEIAGTCPPHASGRGSGSAARSATAIKPADCESYNVRFAADRKIKQDLERLAEVLGKDPQRDLAELVGTALDIALERRDPERRQQRRLQKKQEKQEANTAVPPRPNKAKDKGPLKPAWRGKSRSRHIPVKVKDEVMRRAGYQCEAAGIDGTRCICRSGLEIDHRIPFGKGGGHEPANLQVLCRAHNLRKAELDYGICLIGATG